MRGALTAHVGGKMKRTKPDSVMSDTTQTPRSGLTRHIPLLVILAVAALGFFTLGDYLTFETLRDNREALLEWRDTHYGRWLQCSSRFIS